MKTITNKIFYESGNFETSLGSYIDKCPKTKDTQSQWQSPKYGKPYYVKNVSNDVITIARLGGGKDSLLRRTHVEELLEQNNTANGTMARKQFEATVANMTAIGFFIPGYLGPLTMTLSLTMTMHYYRQMRTSKRLM